MALEDRNISLYTNCKVKDIHRGKEFKLSTTNEEFNLFTANKIILAVEENLPQRQVQMEVDIN